MSVRASRRSEAATQRDAQSLTQRIARVLLEQVCQLLRDAVGQRAFDGLRCFAEATVESSPLMAATRTASLSALVAERQATESRRSTNRRLRLHPRLHPIPSEKYYRKPKAASASAA